MNNYHSNITKYHGLNPLNLKRDSIVPSVGDKLFRLTSKSTDSVH
ncbi:hypothetical protein [Desulfosporosinus sp. SB140]